MEDKKEELKGGEQEKMPVSLISVKQCACFRCGYKWVPNKQEETPLRCPECGSPYWNRPKRAQAENEK